MKMRDKIRMMPLLVLVATMAFGVRVGDFMYGLDHMGAAMAQEEVKAEPPAIDESHVAEEPVQDSHEAPAEGEDHAAADGEAKVDPDASADSGHPADGGMPDPDIDFKNAEKVEWKDAGDTDIDHSAVKDEIYKDLAKRREQLDAREKEITVREALLSAAERELDQKVRELTTLKGEIEAMMKKRSEEEEARIASLVKIYEGMKAKDAARIFNTLDLDVLMIVLTKMSERKSAPILAEMEPERARTVTILMAEQKKAPALPQN